MDFITPIERLIYNFTWRRLFTFLLFLTMLFAVALAYEKYTSQLQLARIEKSITLVSAIHDLDSKGLSPESDLAKVRNNLVSQLADSVSPVQPITVIPAWGPKPSLKLKFVCAAFPWLLLLCWQGKRYFVSMTGPHAGRVAKSVWAVIFGGLFSATVGVLIPTFWWPWFNLVIFPFLPFILLFALVTMMDALAKK